MKINLLITNGTAAPADAGARELFAKFRAKEMIEVEYKTPSQGSMPMLGLWWLWMTETAEYMHGKGCRMPFFIAPDGSYQGERDFAKEDAHELFTSKHLGTGENGNRISWSRDKKKPDQIIADSGQRVHALNQHEIYCTERGIKLTNPIKSEYREIMQRMES